VLGDFVPAKLGFDPGERCIAMKSQADPENDRGTFVLLFANGKGVRIPADVYATKSNRRKLTGAYSDSSACVGIFYLAEGEDRDVLLTTTAGRGIILSTALIPLKTTRTSAGVQLITLKAGQLVEFSAVDFDDLFENPPKLRKTKIPAAGIALPENFKIPYTDLPLD
jgi:DNA gyrase subunit A